MPCIIDDIINSSNNLDEVIVNIHSATDGIPLLRRRMYILYPSVLSTKFGKEKTLTLLNDYALFDMHDESTKISRAATSLHNRFEKMRNIPLFKAELEKNQMVGLVNQDLLYVAHLCVKPDSKKYQVTCFGKGIGPTGDTQHHSIDDIIESEFHLGYKVVAIDELTRIEPSFLPV